eukprot:TRINITY_DN1581_c0_g1_i1.p1 TRINITY_DN1581_c0_g1~~TRINITY_DN1581_c0_g1_i1.p1  ORF type:complete len:119 (-),score=2.23 TRINITY_DN1581_c0_g1_i1:211-567(-)
MGNSPDTRTEEQREVLPCAPRRTWLGPVQGNVATKHSGLAPCQPDRSPLCFFSNADRDLVVLNECGCGGDCDGWRPLSLATSETDDGCIIAETNFRVHAYTNSSAHRGALLCLFFPTW